MKVELSKTGRRWTCSVERLLRTEVATSVGDNFSSFYVCPTGKDDGLVWLEVVKYDFLTQEAAERAGKALENHIDRLVAERVHPS